MSPLHIFLVVEDRDRDGDREEEKRKNDFNRSILVPNHQAKLNELFAQT